MIVNRPLLLLVFACVLSAPVVGQTDSRSESAEKSSDESSAEPPKVVKDLAPLFDQVIKAKTIRATVQLTADTVIDGAVVGSQKSAYQIASKAPDQFTVYFKDDHQRTRIFCDGKTATVALSPTAYTHLKSPITNQQAVLGLPVAMGPYPEVVLALTLAGVDPKLSLTTGMKSVRLVDQVKFRGKTPSLHFEGIQDDDVRWELWVTKEKPVTPLRLLVDLTAMLRANGDLELPKGYLYLLQFDFDLWRTDVAVDKKFFQYTPLKGAKEYESIESYFAEAQQEK